MLQQAINASSTEFIRDELKVNDIMKARYHSKPTASQHEFRLAYLSACSSAANRCIDRSDEPLHIASVFQLAGFDNVVGTLWDTMDDVCIDIAGNFYRHLFEFEQINNSRGMREDKDRARKLGCTEALHLAVAEARDKYWQAPFMWAPFVHWGV